MKKIILVFSFILVSLSLYSQNNIKKIQDQVLIIEGLKETYERVEFKDSTLKDNKIVHYTVIGYYENDNIQKIEFIYIQDNQRSIEYHYFHNKNVILTSVMNYQHYDLLSTAHMFFIKNNKYIIKINGKKIKVKKLMLNTLAESIYTDITLYKKLLHNVK